MPRHPPCALHSLSHKHSTKTTKKHNPTTSPIKEAAGHYKNNQTTTPHPTPQNTGDHAILGRCQMLASTIHLTNTPPTNPHPTPHRHRGRKRGTEKTSHPTSRHQTHANRQGHGPDSSGPNSVPRQSPLPAPTPGSTPLQQAGRIVLRDRRRPRQPVRR